MPLRSQVCLVSIDIKNIKGTLDLYNVFKLKAQYKSLKSEITNITLDILNLTVIWYITILS